MTHYAVALYVLGILLTGVLAQHSVTQDASKTATPGQTVVLPCTLGGGLTVAGNYVIFVQQKLGSTLRGLMYYLTESNKGKGPGVPDRFVGSGSGSVGALTITGVLPEDDAVYYCVSWTGSQWIFGGGTQLNVLSGETKAPTLSIFPPSTEEIDTNKATLVCQCQDFYPAALAWTWTVNDQTINTGVDSTRPTKQTDNNLFMAGSFLSINAIDWKANNIYTCKATHEGKIFQASVKQSECI